MTDESAACSFSSLPGLFFEDEHDDEDDFSGEASSKPLECGFDSRGKRHPLPALLSLACCAMLCGYRSSSAIAEWGRNDGTRMAQALGFTHNTPCAATLHTVMRRVDRDAVEAK